MTIPKRNKRRQKRGDNLPPPIEKEIQSPTLDKMVHNYPRVCRYCHQGSYSARCSCGGLTVITKGGING